MARNKKFYTNEERHQHLRKMLMEGDAKDRLLAHKLAYEWIKTGVFQCGDMFLYCERIADVSASNAGK